MLKEHGKEAYSQERLVFFVLFLNIARVYQNSLLQGPWTTILFYIE